MPNTCVNYEKKCGGCPLLALPYREQLAQKQARLQELLGGFAPVKAVHICSNCGHAEHLFGEGGGARLAEQYGVELLASMPLSMLIREQADNGKPTVVAEPECQISMVYQELARLVGARIVLQAAAAQAMPTIMVSED